MLTFAEVLAMSLVIINNFEHTHHIKTEIFLLTFNMYFQIRKRLLNGDKHKGTVKNIFQCRTQS